MNGTKTIKERRKQPSRWRKVTCTEPSCGFAARMTRKAFSRVTLVCPDEFCAGTLKIDEGAS